MFDEEGCTWNAMSFECSQLNCEKIFGWQNCAKSAGCVYTPDDAKCNDQSELPLPPYSCLQFGQGTGVNPAVTGITPDAFARPNMFNLPSYQNPINGDTLEGYYGGFEPEHLDFMNYANPMGAFEMEDLFKNPMMYSSMVGFFNQYMDQKFTVCSTLTDQIQCDIEAACSWSAGSCTRNNFGVQPGFPALSKTQESSETPDENTPVVFYVALGFAGVILGFLSAVGLQTLCCEKKREEHVGLDQYLRQNV